MKTIVAILLVIAVQSLYAEPLIRNVGAKTGLSVMHNSGNTDITTIEAENKVEANVWAAHVETGFKAFFSESDNVVTARKYEADLLQTWKFWKIVDRYEKAAWLKDEFAGIAGRYDIETGFGVRALTTPSHAIETKLGFLYRYEDRIENLETQQSPSLSSQAEYTYSFRDPLGQERFKFSQEFEGVFDLVETETYFIDLTTRLETSLTQRTLLYHSYELAYKNSPAAGFKTTDHRLNMGFVIQWK